MNKLSKTLLALLLAAGCAPHLDQRQIVITDESGQLWTAPAPTIVLDAGHGGKDPGAVHSGFLEKDLALEFTQAIQHRLRQMGYRVYLTRSRDVFIPLEERIRIANQRQADLFISIHLNASTNASASGTEVYYARESQATESAWPAALDKGLIAEDNEYLRRLVWDLVLDKSRQESKVFAERLCDALQQQIPMSCKVKEAGFVVIRQAQIPAVLFEIGYLSNREELARILTTSHREKVVEGTVSAIKAHAWDLIRQRGEAQPFQES